MFNEVDGMVVMKEEELIAGECKREEDNCIPQLRANMLAVAGGLAHRAITQNLTKLWFMALEQNDC